MTTNDEIQNKIITLYVLIDADGRFIYTSDNRTSVENYIYNKDCLKIVELKGSY